MQAENLAHGMTVEVADEATGDEPAADADATPDAEPAGQTEEPSPAAPPATEQAVEPSAGIAGVLAKDGKTVLPYGALKGARQEARQYRDRAARAEQELADLKAGKKAEPEETEGLTAQEIDDLAADFPQLKKLATVVARVSQAAPAAPAAHEPADDTGDALQDAIDSVPMLAGWQATDPDKWDRAKAIDRALDGSPKWKDKPLAARFEHVAKLVADEFDIQTQAAAASTAAPTNRKAPDQVIQEAKRNAPNTLSDFKGGAADPSRESIARMPPAQQMRKMEDMTDSEIDAYLRKVG